MCRSLARLPQAQRVALVLVDMEGLSVLEAAELLGVPEGTVKSRCSRGRTALVPLLSGHRDESADPGGNRSAPARVAPTAPTQTRSAEGRWGQ